MPPFDFLRLRNIYNPQQFPIGNDMPQQGGIMGSQPRTPIFPPTTFPQPTLNNYPSEFPEFNRVDPTPRAPNQSEDINSIFNRLYTPQDTASNEMNRYIGGMPQRPTEMSGLRKIGAMLVGTTQGPEAQEKAMYAPFYREMADWQAGYKPRQEAANLERYTNANERQLAMNVATAQSTSDRARTQSEAEDRRRAEQENKYNIAGAKYELEKYKATHPDWDLQKSSDGKIYLVPPRPEMGRPIDTGLKHGDMTDLEMMQWRARIKGIKAGGDEDDWETKTDFSTGVPVLIQVEKNTGRTRPLTGPAGKPVQGRGNTPPQQLAEEKLRANKLVSQNPAYAQFIQIDDNGVRIIGNPPQEVQDYLEAELYKKIIPGDIKIRSNNGPNIKSMPNRERVLPPERRTNTPPPNAKKRVLKSGKTVYVVE